MPARPTQATPALLRCLAGPPASRVSAGQRGVGRSAHGPTGRARSLDPREPPLHCLVLFLPACTPQLTSAASHLGSGLYNAMRTAGERCSGGRARCPQSCPAALPGQTRHALWPLPGPVCHGPPANPRLPARARPPAPRARLSAPGALVAVLLLACLGEWLCSSLNVGWMLGCAWPASGATRRARPPLCPDTADRGGWTLLCSRARRGAGVHLAAGQYRRPVSHPDREQFFHICQRQYGCGRRVSGPQRPRLYALRDDLQRPAVRLQRCHVRCPHC